MSVLAKASDVRKALTLRQSLLVLMYKENLFTTNELTENLPSSIVSLLQDFQDVFSKETLSGLPPLRGIEHQIDSCPELLFQTDQPIGRIPKRLRNYNGK
ncbi:Transposon Ty3-I Gag-Pol polyprotein [Gossypium australe]|uniref:Transposon Ty3-I Gag-Pol polyprotein n=1 Tax=Gossypium australe TaxID=47621 RepID=A0A5B6WHA7_9ROSI|nr:Transposon Ty3-I Gag-Pol polyprotein [Gossypium australe]